MIEIDNALIRAIEKDAEERYPNECCGIIFGHITEEGKKAAHLRKIENSFGEGEEYHRFLITAEDMLSAELYARKNGVDVVGFYHSHPDCPAVPSEYDRAHALPVYSYIITSAQKGKAAETLSYQLENDVFVGEEIRSPV